MLGPLVARDRQAYARARLFAIFHVSKTVATQGVQAFVTIRLPRSRRFGMQGLGGIRHIGRNACATESSSWFLLESRGQAGVDL